MTFCGFGKRGQTNKHFLDHFFAQCKWVIMNNYLVTVLLCQAQHFISLWTRDSTLHISLDQRHNTSYLLGPETQHFISLWTRDTTLHISLDQRLNTSYLFLPEAQHFISLWTRGSTCHISLDQRLSRYMPI